MDSIYAVRRDRLRGLMAQHDIDTAVVSGKAGLFYLTGLNLLYSEHFKGLVVNKTSASLVMPAGEAPAYTAGISPALYENDKEMPEILTPLLGGSVAVEEADISMLHASRLAHIVGLSIDDLRSITPLIEQLRTIKDEHEIASLQEACRLTDLILSHWIDDIRPGLDEPQLRAILDERSRQEGVTESCPGVLIATGVNSSYSHGGNLPRTLQPGDVLYVDCGARYNGYYCDITRSFFLGEPEEEAKKVYNIVLEAQLAGIAAVKPGVAIGDVDRAARRVIETAGYGKYFTHRVGHGLGLAVHEQPSVGDGNRAVLEPGMVITVEPGIYLPGKWGIRIEDDVVVTCDGAKVLNKFPKTFDKSVLTI